MTNLVKYLGLPLEGTPSHKIQGRWIEMALQTKFCAQGHEGGKDRRAVGGGPHVPAAKEGESSQGYGRLRQVSLLRFCFYL